MDATAICELDKTFKDLEVRSIACRPPKRSLSSSTVPSKHDHATISSDSTLSLLILLDTTGSISLRPVFLAITKGMLLSYSLPHSRSSSTCSAKGTFKNRVNKRWFPRKDSEKGHRYNQFVPPWLATDHVEI